MVDIKPRHPSRLSRWLVWRHRRRHIRYDCIFPLQEERERQITMVRERIARVRYERTMTMREPKDEKAQGFESLLTEEEKEGLNEEEKMKRIAAKMEERFKSETRRVSTVTVSHVAFMRNRITFQAQRVQNGGNSMSFLIIRLGLWLRSW